MSNAALNELQALGDALAQLRRGEASVAVLAQRAQSSRHLLTALPERFATVLHELLNRLESSALFSEESCSFSQGDLLDSLQLWLDKAAERLSPTP